MKVKKLAKIKMAAIKGGYVTEGRRGSTNIEDRRPGSTGTIAGEKTLPDSTSGGGGSGSGSNRAGSGRGASV